MGNQSVISIEAVIDYIESHLDGKLELETVAEAVHYSKYHLHRLFTETVGMTIHDYVQRRQLTEAAKLLVFSDKPIIEIAFICGYESQQSFSLAFKAMYKSPPAEYREERSFYPLQLRFILHRRTTAMEFTIQDIRLAEKKDIVDWMNLMRLVIDGYPVMDEDDYLAKLEESIDEKRALVLREGDILIGAMAFTYSPGSIEFLGVHPQYRNRGLQKLFLDALLETYLPGQEISTTTFREQDKADTGHRDMLLQLGFAEKELLTEFGYPTQRFVLPPKKQEDICDIDNDTITKYYGTYSEFLRKKTLLREDYIRQYSAQQKEIKKTEEFIRKNIAGRKAKMARGRQKQLDRMDKMEALEQKEIIPHFHFPVLPLTNTEHLLVKHLAVGYHYPVLSDIDFSIKGGQKVVITGFNGIGKSTLLKTLIGQIPSMQGHFKFSDQVTLGYFEQDLIWDEPEQTPIQIVSNVHPDMVIKDVRKHLARCGISSKHAMQAIGTLSGGEQAKVKMCLLTLIPCNFLIMDEPTNHLDVQAKEALKSALMDFAGTVLLVSHEEAFYREWAQRVISVEK